MCYLESVISPASKLHNTGLLIKREVLDVHLNRQLFFRNFMRILSMSHLAGGMVNSGRLPLDEPLAVEGRLGGQSHFKVSIGAGKWKME